MHFVTTLEPLLMGDNGYVSWGVAAPEYGVFT
ncbi:unnamed protein product, partial [marine sediment metagenome]